VRPGKGAYHSKRPSDSSDSPVRLKERGDVRGVHEDHDSKLIRPHCGELIDKRKGSQTGGIAYSRAAALKLGTGRGTTGGIKWGALSTRDGSHAARQCPRLLSSWWRVDQVDPGTERSGAHSGRSGETDGSG
jgi:hypothetical protein